MPFRNGRVAGGQWGSDLRHTIDEEAVARGDLSIVMSSFLGVAEPPLLPPVRVRLLATRCARQPLYWWRLDTPTGGAAHETSAGSAAGRTGRETIRALVSLGLDIDNMDRLPAGHQKKGGQGGGHHMSLRRN